MDVHVIEEFLFSIKNHHCAHSNRYRKKNKQNEMKKWEAKKQQRRYKFNKLRQLFASFTYFHHTSLLSRSSLFNIHTMTMIIAGWIAYTSTTITGNLHIRRVMNTRLWEKEEEELRTAITIEFIKRVREKQVH